MVNNSEIAAIDQRQRSLPLVAALAVRAGRRSGRWPVPGHKGQMIAPISTPAFANYWQEGGRSL